MLQYYRLTFSSLMFLHWSGIYIQKLPRITNRKFFLALSLPIKLITFLNSTSQGCKGIPQWSHTHSYHSVSWGNCLWLETGRNYQNTWNQMILLLTAKIKLQGSYLPFCLKQPNAKQNIWNNSFQGIWQIKQWRIVIQKDYKLFQLTTLREFIGHSISWWWGK